jgi:YfiH family protein
MKEKLISDKLFPRKHFTTVKSCGDMKDEAARNKLLGILGLDGKKLTLARQVHGVRVCAAEEKDAGALIGGCDGLITENEDIALGIFTADCMPVLMAAKDKPVKAAVHAGWRGLAGGILGNAVKAFRENFSVAPCDISAYIGPHIKKCCYEVSAELEKIFGVKLENGKLDLSEIAENILKKEGLRDIRVSGHCSCCEDNLFFSYRKCKTESRMITVIV